MPHPADHPLGPRNIILCFDGTGNKFGENSNVVRFFRALVKNNHKQQLVYYQPGIGTYNKRQFITRTASKVASAIDQGIALHINDHVKEGYQFIMRNYRKGDEISLFGFSRGAHTARVVAGMLYKVGILPSHNDQQLDFAFSVYQTTGAEGYDLSKEFKQTFSSPVTVEFVGVWDTVSSVGIIPRSHPYTSVNYAVKHFRHALALDERRARFRPNVWNEPTLEREQDLDVDEPDIQFPGAEVSRDNWVYTPPDRDICDVEEVWFSGCHADVGGGSHNNKVQESLSYIPLRWMIKECLLCGTNILFDMEYLRSLGINLNKLARELEEKGLDIDALGFTPEVLNKRAPGLSVGGGLLTAHKSTQQNAPGIQGGIHIPHAPHISHALSTLKTRADIMADKFDQLVLNKVWWSLEFIPMLATYQKEDGNWVRKRMYVPNGIPNFLSADSFGRRNFGQGRYIPFYNGEIKVHVSVKLRMQNEENEYTPAAYNWDIVTESGMLTWVGNEEDEKEEENLSIDTTPKQLKRILVIDGGGFRAYGSLLVLQDVIKTAESRCRHTLRPCDVFDLICGTSTGGLIAILLGRLGLDCATAIEVYKELTLSICGSDETKLWERLLTSADIGLNSKKFDDALAKIIELYTGSENASMNPNERRDLVEHPITNTFVTLTSEAPHYNNRTHCLRSYSTRFRPPPPFGHSWSIGDAVRGTLASNIFLPTFFLGPKHSFGDASFAGFSSPAGLLVKEVTSLWPNENSTSLNLGPCLQALAPCDPQREWAVTDLYAKKFVDQIFDKVTLNDDLRPKALNLVKQVVQLAVDTEIAHAGLKADGVASTRLCPPMGIAPVDLVDFFYFENVDASVNTWLRGEGKKHISDLACSLVELKAGPVSVDEARFIIPPGPPPNTNPGYNSCLDERRPETMIEYLKKYRVFFVIDDSGSMKGDRWTETRDALLEIAQHALEQDVEDIDMRFFNNQTIYRKIKGKSMVESIFDNVKPAGYTPTGATLFAMLDEHITILDRAIHTAEYSTIKPLDIIMLTDGVPTDKPKDVLAEAVVRMKNARHHPNAMGVQIVQIGNDPDASPALKELMYGDVGYGRHSTVQWETHAPEVGKNSPRRPTSERACHDTQPVIVQPATRIAHTVNATCVL
ncbi:hypothetical protein H0H93_001693 [Arthromyces matolae]|nr:hypothetical protein H0H93_001693 [Arthromyces matolae]